jgi:hypothetical protein
MCEAMTIHRAIVIIVRVERLIRDDVPRNGIGRPGQTDR